MNNKNQASELQRQIQSLTSRVNTLTKEQNPIIRVSKAGRNPKPRLTTESAWTRRVIRISSKNVVTGSEVTNGDLVRALFPLNGEDMSVSMKILRATFWATRSSGINSYISVTPGTIVTGNSNAQAAEDYGSGDSLAGITFDIPDVIALTLTGLGTSTTPVFQAISTVPPDQTGTGNTFVADILVAFRV